MKYAILFLCFILISGCVSTPIKALKPYIVPDQPLFEKNGNLICGAQGLILTSSEVHSSTNDTIILNRSDIVSQKNAIYNCQKSSSKRDYCRIKRFYDQDITVTNLNRKIVTLNRIKRNLEKQTIIISPESRQNFDYANAERKKKSDEIVESYKKNLREIYSIIDQYEKYEKNLQYKLDQCELIKN